MTLEVRHRVGTAGQIIREVEMDLYETTESLGIRESSEQVWAPLTAASPDSRFLVCGVPVRESPKWLVHRQNTPCQCSDFGALSSIVGILDSRSKCT